MLIEVDFQGMIRDRYGNRCFKFQIENAVENVKRGDEIDIRHFRMDADFCTKVGFFFVEIKIGELKFFLGK